MCVRSNCPRSLRRIYEVIDKLRAKSFLKHYIRRNEIAQDLQGCSKRLNDVRWTLVVSYGCRLLNIG